MNLSNACPDWTRTGSALGPHSGEETSAGEGSLFHVVQETAAKRFDALDRVFDRKRGPYDDVFIDRPRGFDCRQLELFLRAKMGIEAAFAHTNLLCQLPNRKSLQAVQRGKPGGGVEDG